MKNKKLRILFIFLMKFPTNHPVLTNVYAGYLAKRHDVTWVMPREKPGPQTRTGWNGIRILLTKKIKERNFLFKLYNYISSYFQKRRIVKELFRREKFDIIQTRNDPLDALLALKYSKKYGVPFVYQYSFPIYEKLIYTARRGGSEFPRLFSLIAGYFGEFIVHKIILKKAYAILPISEWMKKDLVKKGIPARKMFPLPMGCAMSRSRNNAYIRKRFKLNNADKVLIYLGNMDKPRNLGFLIEVFKRLNQRKLDFKVLMVGDGTGRMELEKQCRQSKLKNIYFTGKVPKEKVDDYLSVSDIGLSPFNPLPFLLTTSPTKLMEYLGAALPVVCNDTPEQKMILEKTKAGICTDYSVESFSSALESLLKKDKKTLKDMGVRGKKWVKFNREYSILGRYLEAVYETIQKG